MEEARNWIYLEKLMKALLEDIRCIGISKDGNEGLLYYYVEGI